MNPKRLKLFDRSETESLETNVGIEEFLDNQRTGFECILKNRWEDFFVREINTGLYARITNLNPLKDDDKPSDIDHSLLDESCLDELEKLNKNEITEVKIKVSEDKNKRTKIHQLIRSEFSTMASETLNSDDGQYWIRVTKLSKSTNKRSRNSRLKMGIPKDKPYCQFVLYKEGKDTISCVQVLGRYLNVNPSMFAYAGTKDKRAITCQFVTIKGFNSQRLSKLNAILNGIRLGNFVYVDKPLFLGSLDGNQFTVVLRCVQATNVQIEQSVEQWKKLGFINYFGLQRFGHSVQSKTYEIGKHLIRSNWIEAIDLILAPTDADLPHVRELKRRFQENEDAATCHKELRVCLEKTLLMGVSKHGKSLKALQMLPRNLFLLYVHSYQAYVWNHVASKRIRDQPPGDLFAKPGDLYFKLGQLIMDDDNSQLNDTTPTICPSVVSNDEEQPIPISWAVLPLPGYAVQFPKNKSADWYTDLLGTDNLQIADFKHKEKDLRLPGSYRHLIVKPENVWYEFRQYTDPNEPLIENDLDLLKKSTNGNDSNETSVPQDVDSGGNSMKAVILQFDLPKSSYATMAIRELTKTAVERK